MKIDIFTESSGTTTDPASVEQIQDYFKGNFLPVCDLADELSQGGDVTTHILSDKYGYLLGSDDTSKLKSSDASRTKTEFRYSLLESSSTADVVVILLTAPTFRDTVTTQWSDLVSNVNSNSVWCLGASNGTLSSVDIGDLKSSVSSVITYQRVGVAPIDTATKQHLIDIIVAER